METYDYYDVEICMIEFYIDFYDSPLSDQGKLISDYQGIYNSIRGVTFNQPLFF